MYALAVDIVPEQKPMKMRAATSHKKLGARPEANAPTHAPVWKTRPEWRAGTANQLIDRGWPEHGAACGA
jgi:hypothetical protein